MGDSGEGAARGPVRRAPEAANRSGEAYITVQVLGPNGENVPLKVKPSDDVSTLRALVTQM
jgi:hypothetical protein